MKDVLSPQVLWISFLKIFCVTFMKARLCLCACRCGLEASAGFMKDRLYVEVKHCPESIARGVALRRKCDTCHRSRHYSNVQLAQDRADLQPLACFRTARSPPRPSTEQ